MDDHQVTRALEASAQDGRDLAAVTEALDGGRRHGRQAESLARPRRRRFRMMARPPRVLIRARKPCLRARRRLLGWKVRFDTTDASRGIGVDECTRRGADPAERRTTPPANRGSRGRATRTCTGATECAERTALFAPTATGGRGGGADGDPSRGRSTAHRAGAVPSRWPGTAQRSFGADGRAEHGTGVRELGTGRADTTVARSWPGRVRSPAVPRTTTTTSRAGSAWSPGSVPSGSDRGRWTFPTAVLRRANHWRYGLSTPVDAPVDREWSGQRP
jgi:hypothetical protein